MNLSSIKSEDAAALRRLVSSPEWEVYMELVEAVKASCEQDCAYAPAPIEYLRGKLRGLADLVLWLKKAVGEPDRGKAEMEPPDPYKWPKGVTGYDSL